ncbi:MAG: MoeA family protein, partial [Planctomycetota bacterium]
MALLPLEDALERILRHGRPRPSRVALDACDGLRLAEDIVADRDLPPFDRSTLDGYALDTRDPAVRRGEALAVQEVVYAGSPARRRLRPGCATLVMTGAPVPAGADAVLRREDARPLDDGGFVLPLAKVKRGTGIHARGGDASAGDLVLSAGSEVTPGVVAVLASLGAAKPDVYAPPRVS